MATTKDTTTTAEPANPIERRASRGSHASSIEQADENELAQFGYKQELKRDWGLMHNFGISFSIIVRSLLLRVDGYLTPDSQSSQVSQPSFNMAWSLEDRELCRWDGSSSRSSQCLSRLEWQRSFPQFLQLEDHITGLLCLRLPNILRLPAG